MYFLLFNRFHFQYTRDIGFVTKTDENFQQKFQLIDKNLETFGFTKDKKNAIYAVLSSILNLGNIRFQTDNNDICIIEVSTKKFLQNVATLLNVNELALESALTCRTIKIANQQIM